MFSKFESLASIPEIVKDPLPTAVVFKVTVPMEKEFDFIVSVYKSITPLLPSPIHPEPA